VGSREVWFGLDRTLISGRSFAETAHRAADFAEVEMSEGVIWI
jgi:hypothetical protein